MRNPLLQLFVAAGVFLLPSASSAQTSATMPATEATADWMQYKDSYVGEQNDLANPHKTIEEILTWTQEAATEALTLSPAGFNNELMAFKPKFIPQAWQQYSVYIRDSRVAEMVQQQGYTMVTIIDGAPQMLANMPAGGTYHWLVEAPLLMSFSKTNPGTGEAMPATTAKFKLIMQVGRIAAAPDADGLAVENWKIEQLK